MSRKDVAASRLALLREAAPEHRHQRYGDWLQVATAGEVRRHWRPWMGRFPTWAQAWAPGRVEAAT